MFLLALAAIGSLKELSDTGRWQLAGPGTVLNEFHSHPIFSISLWGSFVCLCGFFVGLFVLFCFCYYHPTHRCGNWSTRSHRSGELRPNLHMKSSSSTFWTILLDNAQRHWRTCKWHIPQEVSWHLSHKPPLHHTTCSRTLRFQKFRWGEGERPAQRKGAKQLMRNK